MPNFQVTEKMQVSLRINDKCNFACRYCNVKCYENCEMSMQTASDIIDYCKENDITSANIPEKEPFYNPGLLEHIIEKFNKAGIRITDITTNLYNLPVSSIKLLKKYNIHILGSYDGLWHDDFRVLPNGDLTSATVEKNIFALKGANVRFSLACVVVHDTVDRIYENYKHLLNFTPGIAFNFDVASPYRIRDEDLPIIKSEFEKIVKEPQGLNIFPLWKIGKRIQQNARYSNFMCGAGRGSYCIDWDGTIVPCYHADAWKHRIGITLGDIHNGLDQEEKAKFYEYDTSTPEKCKNCNVKLCGICYVNSFDVMGDMTTPIPINCEIFGVLTNVVANALKKQKSRPKEVSPPVAPPVVDLRERKRKV